MRRVLFITTSKVNDATGGSICSDRNYESLKDIFGKNNVDIFTIENYSYNKYINSLFKYLFAFKGYLSGLSSNNISQVDIMIKNNKYSDIFIDNSLLGIMAKKLKSKYSNLRIHTFFHNIELDFMKQSIKHNRLRFKIILHAIYFNEKCACKYSDNVICLNQRDNLLLYKYYRRKADIQIPITIKDYYFENKSFTPNKKRKGLFLGSYFFGNIDGIVWFCEKVLPYLNIEFTIVGTNMDKIINDIKINEKIHVYSNVTDLRPYFEDADLMILPIVSGSGMKVKTAEALMYGKFIIGSTEALTGYDVDSNVALICDKPEDYINAINNLDIKYKFNQASRDLYLKKYSYKASIDLFSKLINVNAE